MEVRVFTKALCVKVNGKRRRRGKQLTLYPLTMNEIEPKKIVGKNTGNLNNFVGVNYGLS